MASTRDTPASRAILRIDSFCRKCIRRMKFKSPPVDHSVVHAGFISRFVFKT